MTGWMSFALVRPCSTEGSQADTMLAVYQASGEEGVGEVGTRVAFNDDCQLPALFSCVKFFAAAEATYTVQVSTCVCTHTGVTGVEWGLRLQARMFVDGCGWLQAPTRSVRVLAMVFAELSAWSVGVSASAVYMCGG
jgi:hypothetical protein